MIATPAPAALAALHAIALTRGRAWDGSEFARLLATPGAFAFMAPRAAPQGLVLGWVIAREAEILTIAVAPSARRQGLGRALVEAAAARARDGGAARLLLEVAADNTAARALYAAANFVQIGVRRGYYDGGATDALVLARGLV